MQQEHVNLAETERKRIDNQAVLFMLFLSMIWGMQQVSLKAASPDMAPILQIVCRSAIAALIIALFIYIKKQRLYISGVWPFGLLCGTFFSLEYFFVGESLRYTYASHTTVFLYSAPIFVALTLHFLQKSERLNPLQWLGIAIAFAGIALTFLFSDHADSTLNSQVLWGDFLGLLSGMFWAGATVVARCSVLRKVPAAQTLFYQLIAATVLLGFTTIYKEQTEFQMTTTVWMSILYQGFIVCAFSFLLWYWLLKQYPAAQLGVFSFATPIFGIIFAILLLDESLELSFIGGSCLVFIGITLVTVRRNKITTR